MGTADATLTPPIRVSQRFDRAYRKANLGLAGLIEGAVQELVSRIRGLPKTFLLSYDRLARVPDVIEIDVTGGHRMLGRWQDGEVQLLLVGGHEIVAAYEKGDLVRDQLTLRAAPKAFWPPTTGRTFFRNNPCRAFSVYGQELSTEWLYFLSDQQRDVQGQMLERIYDALAAEQSLHCLLLGGPGTGKTSVLLNLLKDLTDCTTARLGIQLSDGLLQYINASLPGNLVSDMRVRPRTGASIDALMIDDPASLGEIADAIAGLSYRTTVSVSALDPFQLWEAVPDTDLLDFAQSRGIQVWELDECYRQKENLGRQTKAFIDAIADSTPFLAARKVAEYRERLEGVTRIANDLRFPNPHGHVYVYEPASEDDVRTEVNWVQSRPLWKQWPPLLVVTHTDLSSNVQRVLESINHRVLHFSEANAVKGLEYQHVFLFLQADLFEQLEHGFRGSGQAIYNARRLLRIPFSRGKDSTVTFVM